MRHILVLPLIASALASSLISQPSPIFAVSQFPDTTSQMLLGSPLLAKPTFGVPALYDSGVQSPNSMAVADVNGDGKLDLIVTNSGEGKNGLSVLLGNGDGTFQAPLPVVFSSNQAESVAVADVNLDGKPDLVVDNGGAVSVLLGNGDGTFQPPVSVDLRGQSSGQYQDQGGPLAVVDVNGDGKPDIVVAVGNYNVGGAISGFIEVLLGNGNGTFQAATTYGSGGQVPTALAVADLNGDGYPDVVVTNACEIASDVCDNVTGIVGVLINNGDGTFAPVNSMVSGGTSASSVVIGDVNGDGKPDLVVGALHPLENSGNDSVVLVLLGVGNGNFQTPVPYDSGGFQIQGVALQDVNGDGKLDLVVANCADSAVDCEVENGIVEVLLGKGDGTFRDATTFSTGPIPTLLAVKDVNGDGKPDLLLTSATTCQGCTDGAVGVFLNISGAPHKTTIALTSSADPCYLGAPITYSVVVSGNPGVPAGSVTFKSGEEVLGTVSLTGGQASLNTTCAKTGARAIIARYPGNQDFRLASATLKQVVEKYATTTSLESGPNPSKVGQSVTFTATVSDASSAGPVPTGIVKFKNGSKLLGTGTLSAGVASITTSKLPAGNLSITATYPGDEACAGSTSSELTQVID